MDNVLQNYEISHNKPITLIVLVMGNHYLSEKISKYEDSSRTCEKYSGQG
jgi:hypothetical protein